MTQKFHFSDVFASHSLVIFLLNGKMVVGGHHGGEGYEGKGLGLAFVKEVIDLHRGKILVQSEPNVGSIFSILLPVKDVAQEENQKIYEEVSFPSNH